ncbi:MAG: NAD(P)H-hydrate dehydratase [Planctomycetes bacterium]|nr:NAD(P)H-hydrate dehydratase [Planctomycetota bacterium]
MAELPPMLDASYLPTLPARRPDSHKGDYGRVLVVAGSRGMIGAACLASSAALRAGAGLVTLATPASQQPIAATKLTAVMTLPLSETAEGTLALDAANQVLSAAVAARVVALGPGLSMEPETVTCVRRLVREVAVPLVLDADALSALAGHLDLLAGRRAASVLTPHPGEFRRLEPGAPPASPGGETGIVREFAAAHRVVLVLKTHRTVVSDGERVYVNDTGNPGMATGGTGDVLTGVVAGLLAQGFAPFDAACLAVHLHGRAGDLARDRFGEYSMTAEDVLASLPDAFRAHQASGREVRP